MNITSSHYYSHIFFSNMNITSFNHFFQSCGHEITFFSGVSYGREDFACRFGHRWPPVFSVVGPIPSSPLHLPPLDSSPRHLHIFIAVFSVWEVPPMPLPGYLVSPATHSNSNSYTSNDPLFVKPPMHL